MLELETKSHSLMKKLSNEVHFRNIMSCHELWSWLTKLASHALLINMHHTFIKLHEVRTTCLFWNAPLLPSSTKFKAVSSSLNFSLIIIIPLLSNLTNIPMHGAEKYLPTFLPLILFLKLQFLLQLGWKYFPVYDREKFFGILII